MLISRNKLEENLIPVIFDIASRPTIVKGVKNELERNEIDPGLIQKIINNPEEELPKIDVRFLYLLTSSIYKYRTTEKIKPLNYFTETEVKESVTFSGLMNLEERISLPQSLNKVIQVSNNSFITKMDIKELKKFTDAGLFFYDFESQREHRKIIRGDEVILIPKVSQDSVEQIAEHLLNGTLVPTLLTFNAVVRTADNGDELLFNDKTDELVITKGTRIANIDGYHRMKGFQLALSKNPDLSFSFPVMFVNYTTRRAAEYIGQISKANPIELDWADQLSKSKYADDVVENLQQDTDLKGKITQTRHISHKRRELVSYRTLVDAIDEEFEMHTKADSMDVSEYLVDFFNYLVGSNEDAFINEIDSVNRVSVINENLMFSGYIVLARRMFENDIKVNKLRKILKDIDFNRENEMWEELGILKDGKIYKKSLKNIKDYFRKLDISEIERVTN